MYHESCRGLNPLLKFPSEIVVPTFGFDCFVAVFDSGSDDV